MADPADDRGDWTSQLPTSPGEDPNSEYLQSPANGQWYLVPKMPADYQPYTAPAPPPEGPSWLDQQWEHFKGNLVSYPEALHESDLANVARTADRIVGEDNATGKVARSVVGHNPLLMGLMAASKLITNRRSLIPETDEEIARNEAAPQGFNPSVPTLEGVEEGLKAVPGKVADFARGAVNDPGGTLGGLVASLEKSPELLLMPEAPGLATSRVAMNAARAAKAGRAAEITAMALGKVAGDTTTLGSLLAGSEAVREYGNTGQLDPEKITETAGSGALLGAPLAYLSHSILKPTVRSILDALAGKRTASGGAPPGESAGALEGPPGASPEEGGGSGGATFDGETGEPIPGKPPRGALPKPAVSYSLGELVQRAQDVGVDHEEMQPIMSAVLRKQIEESDAKQQIGELINNAASVAAAKRQSKEKPAPGKTESTTAAPAAEASQPVSQEPALQESTNGTIRAEPTADNRTGDSAVREGQSEVAQSKPAEAPAPVPDERGVVQTTVADQPVAVNVKPSELQKASGNYQKGHIEVQGIPITIENPKGTERSGVTAAGNPWVSTLNHDYGYIKRTVGNDGEQVDTFIGPNPHEADKVYVIDQHHPDGGGFDEHKAMVGFDSRQEAIDAYNSNYPAGHDGARAATPMPIDQFKDWLANGNTREPARYTAPTLREKIEAGKIAPSEPEKAVPAPPAEQPPALPPGEPSGEHGPTPQKTVSFPIEVGGKGVNVKVEVNPMTSLHEVTGNHLLRYTFETDGKYGLPDGWSGPSHLNAPGDHPLTTEALRESALAHIQPDKKTLRQQLKEKKAKAAAPEPEPDYPEVGQGEEEIAPDKDAARREKGLVVLGENADGEVVWEDGRGVRSVVTNHGNGEHITEKVKMIPTRQGGVRTERSNPDDPRFQPVEAKAETQSLAPGLVYHGSHVPNITSFNRLAGAAARRGTDSMDTVGSWWSVDRKDASAYGEHVYEAALHVTNPLRLESIKELMPLAKKIGATFQQPDIVTGEPSQHIKIAGSKLRAYVEQEGYDSIHIKGGERGHDYWIALHPEQVDIKGFKSRNAPPPGEQIDYETTMEPVAAAPEQVEGAPEPPTVQISGFLSRADLNTVAHLRRELANPDAGVMSIHKARSIYEKDHSVEAGAADKGLHEKRAEELTELAIVQAARHIVETSESPIETFDDLVALYGRQPNLNKRTSTSIEQQAYSTPAPLAYVASQLAGITHETQVLEPTAGNGMLLIGANPHKVLANELNPDRRRILQDQNFYHVTQMDASAPGWWSNSSSNFIDAVITNPPFGVVREANGSSRQFSFELPDGKKVATTEIDHAIVMESLKAMKDDGSAVLIIGGINKLASSREARSDAYNGAAKRKFFFALYGQYNVTNHFTVSGDLYAKQGAAWPVDVIQIQGRGKSQRALPAVDVPQVYTDWESLKPLLGASYEQPSGVESGAGEQRPRDIQHPVSAQPGAHTRPVSEPAVQSNTNDAGQVSRPIIGESDSSGAAGGRRAAVRAPVAEEPEPSSELAGVVEPESAGAVEPAGSAGGPELDEAGGDAGSAPRDGGGPAEPAGPPRELGERRVASPLIEGAQQPYKPTSRSPGLDTLVPTNIRSAIDDALNSLQDQVGQLDAYVAKELGYKPEEISNYFAGEQVDALALALKQMKDGKGFIIGDQTGIGKGRVVAGVIRWALKNGRTPIFVTEKPNLYKDMYRDLTDIGVKQIRPIMTNGNEKVPLTDEENGPMLKTAPSGRHNDDLRKMAEGGSLGEYNMIFTTYNQMQTLKGNLTERMSFLNAFAGNGVVIFDESHNAGGNDAGDRGKKQADGETKTGRAAFARGLAAQAKGVFYSSATYAKRPSVMDLYFKTDMAMAVENNVRKLPGAIAAGGVPLQQAVAAQLTQAGQYVRRERSFQGVEYNTPKVPVDRGHAELISGIMMGVKEFDDIKKLAVKELKEEAKSEAKAVTGSSAGADAESTNFTSIMHNVIDQMLLALKADQGANLAIEALKRGEKPVITVANTMGSFIQEYAENAKLKGGDTMALSFKDLLMRYLEKARNVTIKSPDGSKYQRRLTDEELGESGVRKYNQVKQLIKSQKELDRVPISPIDWIHHRLREAGYTSSEITGRGHTLQYHGETKPVDFDKDIEERKNLQRGLSKIEDAIRELAGKNRKAVGFNWDDRTARARIDQWIKKNLPNVHGASEASRFKSFAESLQVAFEKAEKEARDLGSPVDMAKGSWEQHRAAMAKAQDPGFVLAAIEALRDARYQVMAERENQKGKLAPDLAKGGKKLEPTYTIRPGKQLSIAGRNETISNFNNGLVDVIILNQAGATGLSLHASKKFKDQRPRRMILVQAEKNIDTHMQILGRIDRSGQIHRGSYDQLVADIPAEKRQAAVLSKKMASLNANTTGARSSKFSASDAIDFINLYGDQAAAELMDSLPELHIKLGEPLEKAEGKGGGYEVDEAARKVTGRLPLLPVAEQEAFYEIFQQTYQELLQRADAMGENALEAKTLDLDAKPVSKTELFPGQAGSDSPFAVGSDAQVMDVKRLGKPFTSEQVKARVAEHAGVPDMPFEMAMRHASREWDQLQRATMQEYAAYRSAEEAKMTQSEMPETAQEGRLAMLDGQASRWQEKANFLEPGMSFLLKTPEGVEFYGVLSKIDRKKGIKLPVALGSWVAHFDVADGMRQITFPFSQIGIGSHSEAQVSGVSLERATRNQMTGVKVMDMFDQGQTSSREKRTIVTGNLLAGFSKVRRGQIVNYTAHDGSIQQGVLMPRNFDLKEFAESQPVELSPDQIPRFFRNAQQGIVRTADGIMQIVEVNQGFKLSVPKSKAEGGKYFLDPDIREITGDFASQGSRMNVTVNQAKLASVTQILADKFKQRLYTDTFRDEAIRAGGKALASGATKTASMRRGAERPTLTLRQQMNPDVHDYLQRVAGALKGRARVMVHGRPSDFGRHIGQDVPNDIYGVYTDEDSTLHFIASNIKSVEQAQATFLHEGFGHLAMEEFPEFKKALEMVSKLRKAGGKKINELWDEVARQYPDGLSETRHRKEVIALMVERGMKNAIVDRAVTGVHQLLQNLGIPAQPEAADLARMILQAARGLPEAARKLAGIDRMAAFDVEKFLQAGQEGKAQDAMGRILPESEAIDALAYARAHNDPHAVLVLKDISADLPEDASTSSPPDEEDAFHPVEGTIPKGVLFSRHAPMDPEAKAAKDKVMPGDGRDNLSLRDRIRLSLKALTNFDGLAVLQNWVDDQASLERYERMLNNKVLKPGDISPLKAARSVRNLASQMAAALEKGIPVYRDGAFHVVPGRKSINAILAPLHENASGSLVTHLELYVAALRASRLINERNKDGTSREKNFTQDQIDAALKLGDTYPELKKVAADLQEMFGQLLDLGEKAGTIDPAARAIYGRHFYVPFYRLEGLLNGDRAQTGRARGGIANQREMSGHLSGKAAPLNNILENILMNVANQLDAAQKAIAMQKVADAYQGVFMHKEAKPTEAVKISNDQVERAMKKLGLAFDPGMTDEQREAWSTFFRRVAPTDHDVVRVMRKGKPEYHRVTDPLVLEAITALQGSPKWLRDLDKRMFGLLSGPKRFYTAMVTATPMYTARRFVRVMMDTWMQSNYKLGLVKNAYKDFYDAIKGHPDLYDMMMAGSGGAQGYDSDPERVRDMLINSFKDGNKHNFVLKAANPKSWWRVWCAIQRASKNEHMLRVYRAARATGQSVAEAAFRARDIEDLSMHGGGAIMQFINRTVPFLNPRIQGTYRMVRGFKDNWKAYAIRGAAVMMGTLALQAINFNNPRYQELPQWQKDVAWHVFVGDHHFLLPKPFELGLIFATIPERIVAASVHALDGKGGDTLGQSIDALKRAVLDTFALNPIPQVLRPFIEQATNTDAFGNSIIRGSMEKVEPQEQYNAFTSPTVRAIAGAMPGSMNYVLNSPARLQALIQSIAGTLGLNIVQGADRLTRLGLGYGDAPSSSVLESSVSSFYQHGEPHTTKYTEELYDFMGESDKAFESVTQLAKDGRLEQAQKKFQSKEKIIELRNALNGFGKEMRELTKQEVAVMHSPDMSAADKEAALKVLTKQRNDIARQVAPFEDFF